MNTYELIRVFTQDSVNLSYFFPPILTETDNFIMSFALAQRLTIAKRVIKIDYTIN
jgi:hypothetical protein